MEVVVLEVEVLEMGGGGREDGESAIEVVGAEVEMGEREGEEGGGEWAGEVGLGNGEGDEVGHLGED